MREVVIYGAGNRGVNICEILERCNSEYRVVALVDGSSEKVGQSVGTNVVEGVESLNKYSDKAFCITVHNSRIIGLVRNMLFNQYGYVLGNEIEYERILYDCYSQKYIEEKAKEVCANDYTTYLFDGYMGLGLGGIEMWTQGLCKELIKYNSNIRIFTDDKEYKVYPELALYIDSINRMDKNNTEDSYNNFRELCNYYISKLPCVIVTNRPNVELMAAAVVKSLFPDLVRVISAIHMGTPDTYRKYAEFKDYVECYMGVSEDIEEGMIEHSVSTQKVRAMKCPFPCKELLNRDYTYNKEMPIKVGYAGRLDSISQGQKRMDLIMKCIEYLDNRRLDFVFEFVGDGPARESIEKWINDNDYKDKVRLIGRLDRNKIHEFWQMQDICINLADFEGRSLSILEAMGNGAVPVVTATSGIREDITDSENGFVVPIGDWKEAAQKILYLNERRELLGKMGAAARKRVIDESDFHKHAKIWMEILDM